MPVILRERRPPGAKKRDTVGYCKEIGVLLVAQCPGVLLESAAYMLSKFYVPVLLNLMLWITSRVTSSEERGRPYHEAEGSIYLGWQTMEGKVAVPRPFL